MKNEGEFEARGGWARLKGLLRRGQEREAWQGEAKSQTRLWTLKRPRRIRARTNFKIAGFLLLALLLSFTFVSLRAADDNPFAPEGNATMIVPPAFERQEVRFDSNARIIKSISIKYVNLDGSEGELGFELNKSLDWHDLYVFARQSQAQPTPVLDLSVTMPTTPTPPQNEQRLSPREQKIAELNQILAQNSSENTSRPLAGLDLPVKSEQLYELLGYSVFKQKIRLNTKDALISNSSLGDPSKIILDFKGGKIQPSRTVLFENSAFKRLDFASHKDYYRIVLYLDGKYDYALQKDAQGYVITLR